MNPHYTWSNPRVIPCRSVRALASLPLEAARGWIATRDIIEGVGSFVADVLGRLPLNLMEDAAVSWHPSPTSPPS